MTSEPTTISNAITEGKWFLMIFEYNFAGQLEHKSRHELAILIE